MNGEPQERRNWLGRIRSPEGRPVRRRVMIVVDVLLFLLVGTLLVQRALPQAAAAFNLGSGSEPAPSFELRSLDGRVVSLDEYRGQVVLVNFWASWCPPCRVEMPGFERVYRQRRDEGFVILGIATDTHAEDAIREFVEEHGITYPILLADRQVIQDYGGIRSLPETFLVDRNGVIRHRVIGYFAEPALRAAVGRMLAGRDPT
jgi:cytochrome c biogenesis protein CcmG, thiol:disulfide interchange protein DsbE